MNLKSVLEKCEQEGHPMTAPGLYLAGKKYGFIIRKGEKNSYELDKDKFLEWLKKATTPIPEGWMTLKQVSEKLGISIAQVYILIQDEECGAEKFGSGAGVLYVDPERIEKVIQKRKDSYSEEW